MALVSAAIALAVRTMETTPRRIRLSRLAGSRLPEGAVSVARPTRWGNPFKRLSPATGLICQPGIGRDRSWDLEPRISRPGRHDQWFGTDDVVEAHVRFALPGELAELYRLTLFAPTAGMRWASPSTEGRMAGVTVEEIRAELAGKDLACWCLPGCPCHADVLLSIANGWDLGPLVDA